MKKIIAVFDGLKFSEKTAHCSLYVCKQTNAHLVGVFLEDKTRIGYSLKDFIQIKGSHINAI